jgi:uncharacterized Zn finger protein (UPF0148 family)
LAEKPPQGEITIKHGQHEVKMYDHKGKHTSTAKRCQHCGVVYHKPAKHQGRIECPTCGADPERLLR